MKTFSAKPAEVNKKWVLIDAKGLVVGRLATLVAMRLRGKHLPTYTPHVDCGDNVIIINCAQAVLTGNKLEQKKWQRHTGWIGNLKTTKYATLMAQRPTKAMELAVGGMIPNTTIGRKAETRLHCFAGAEHPHASQKPEVYEF
jgi:large subunit ribosomal protein L13